MVEFLSNKRKALGSTPRTGKHESAREIERDRERHQ
jgi:hypothetical protein